MGSAAPRQCGACAGPLELGQEYCLECGARVAAPPGRSLHWLWPSLAALVVSAAGAAVAIVATGSGGAASARTIVATQALTIVPPSTSQHRPQGGERKSAGGAPLPGRVGSLVVWPPDKRFTNVIAVVPVQAGLSAARTEAEQAVKQGLRSVGVLVSSSYSSLHPGYYLVFSGAYDTLEEAQSDLPSVRARVPSAFAQQVSR